MQNNLHLFVTTHTNVRTNISGSCVSKIEYIKISKRGMLARTTGYMRNLMYRGNIHAAQYPENLHQRDMSTWAGYTRSQDPVFSKVKAKTEIDNETGLTIMHPVDESGKNHVLLVEIDWKHPEFVKVHGVFTSKTTPYNEQDPDMVANVNLEGYSEPQFLHKYKTPMLARKTDVHLNETATYTISENSQYIEYIKIYIE